MHAKGRVKHLLVAVAMCVVAACAVEPTTLRVASEPSAVVRPLCQLGCGISDPFPDSPGVFLGPLVTPDACFWNGNDLDNDNLSDVCETYISQAFSPELRYWSDDDVRREPYWVARQDSVDHVIVGYLFSYYRDAGSNAFVCQLPLSPDSCRGHNGDSEAIFFSIAYNSVTQHWVLWAAYYSQHDGYGSQYAAPGGYAGGVAGGVEYPTHAGAYPRVWVSEGKHANYFHQGDCNGGGFLGTDTCQHVNSLVRLEWSNYWNIGSRAHPFVDSVASRDPNSWYYGSGRKEYFWTNQRFRGWIPNYVGGDDADPYSPRLRGLGY